MTIRTKMTVLFLSIVTVLLLVFCVTIYFLSDVYRQSEFETRLKREALTAATIVFNKEEVSPDLLKILSRNQMTALSKENIVIFNAQDKVIYQSGLKSNIYTPAKLQEIKRNEEVFWEEGEVEEFGMTIRNRAKDYIVIVSAVDKYGLSKQHNLAILLSFGSILLIALSAIIGRFFAGGLLKPMQQMIKEIDAINASYLSLRLSQRGNKDELGQLAQRFNEMLDRLQKAFHKQRAFVSHASHELRTPLTAITGQIQVSLLANDNMEELRNMAKSVLEDVNQLNILTNNLLELNSIDVDDIRIKASLLNVVDLLLQAKSEVSQKYPESKIVLQIDDHEDYLPEIYANESLIYSAFINLIENAVKFASDQTAQIKLLTLKDEIQIKFQNKLNTPVNLNIDIIFDPFIRGANSKNVKGHGVGLSLTKRIIDIHKGHLTVNLEESEFVEFILFLPKGNHP
ncbi:HAMP domain-containing sensor histidine kinase [Pedobacter puniceum]|uniref:histidine kinase n=1 Tax=Pedobacter puniceum TaxID=2666136 RepID=A0A7K0FQJ2_9SPHI|nr:HAMP domain-containing sensor histidine kinase [Pedobacter puniceum]MRX47901.1 HAMP domain-containing protein [Pedobacter puniceum]